MTKFHEDKKPPRIFILMGVSGAGKSTLGERLARHLGCEPLLEADDLHTAESRERMRSGIPLTDQERWPWLARLNTCMQQRTGDYLVVACSALKASYRERLLQGCAERVHFIFLDAPRQALERHHRERVHAYMPASLLDSQLEILEPPGSDEQASSVLVAGSVEESFREMQRIVERIILNSAVKEDENGADG